MKSVLRRQEKRRAARDVKRIASGADNQLFRGKKKNLLFTLYIHALGAADVKRKQLQLITWNTSGKSIILWPI